MNRPGSRDGRRRRRELSTTGAAKARRKELKRLRPKKNPTAFGLFFREFVKKNKGKFHGPEMMKEAGKEWAKLNEKKKEKFFEKVAKESAKHQKEVDKWKEQDKQFKPPPTAYALFTQHYWKENPGVATTGFMAVARACAEQWRALPEARKAEFTQEHDRLAEEFKQRVEATNEPAAANDDEANELDDVDSDEEEYEDEDGEEEEDDDEDLD